ncbi:MAG TPA: hypothetical protein VM145_00835 [Sphingomicrobium sp.]|nr:hypothetical protein [Sphingomicrobium sp.]
MRALAFLAALGLSAQTDAQAVVTSPAPERVAVTVYRNPDRGPAPMNLEWLGGYALVSETRRVQLPPGESELRFEGVTSGIVPQSAIVTGLGEAVLEKNRDARLLSPGALLDSSLGERLHLRRTSKETGSVREQDAVVRATSDGVVLQTADGIEALRCTGVPETLVADRVPVGLSAKPTLSVRVRSPQAMQRTVTLSYITNNFDWQANYVAELAPAGGKISLFAWLTLANGDQTALANAQTQAVAGRLNRRPVSVPAGDSRPITISCWPQAKTSDIDEAQPIQLLNAEEIVVTGGRIASAAAPPPPPPAPERGGEDVIASEERLGDVRLYRIPIEVTVAAKSQKQVAFLKQPAVTVQSVYRLQPPPSEFESALERVLVSRNELADGLGLPLPSGGVTVFARYGDRRILLGEGSIDDHAVGEKVEIKLGEAPGIRARGTVLYSADGNQQVLTISNDSREARTVEIRLPPDARSAAKLTKRDGGVVWRATVPANGTAELRYRLDR